MNDRKHILWAVTILGSASLAFAVDLLIPGGIADGVLYLPVVLFSVWLQNPRVLYFAAILCSLLAAAGMFGSPGGGMLPWTWGLIDRLPAFLAIWVTASFGFLITRRTGELANVKARQLAEVTVRASETRLQQAVRVVVLGIFEHDHGTDTLHWSPEMRAIYGYGPDEPVTFATALHSIHPEDRDMVAAAIQQAHDPSGDGGYEVEHRIVRRDGSVRWVKKQARTFFEGTEATRHATRTVGAVADVTERRLTEAALRESEQRLRLFVEHAPAALAMFDHAMRYLAVSLRWMADYRLGDQDIIGRLHYDVFPQVPECWKAAHRRGLEGEVIRADEDRYVWADGSVQWLRWEVRPWYASDGNVGGIVIFTEDITARRQAEESLREREARLQAILDTAVDGIITINEHGIIESVNPAAEMLFGYPAAEMIGRNVTLLMPPPYREEHDGYLANYLRTGIKHMLGIGREVQGRRKDGSIFPLELALNEVCHGARWFTGILHDLSRRRMLERQVLEIAALEQQRIGQELHDGVGQELTGLGMMAGALARRLAEGPPAEQELARGLAEGLIRVHEQVRALCRGLITVELDAGGLQVALAELAIQTRDQSGIACRFECPEPVLVSDPPTAKHLYRIAQEAVSNALRHGRPQRIRLGLCHEAEDLRLTIQDDGIGVQEPLNLNQGLGLSTMRYRAGMLGGTLLIGPAEGGGTLVACSVPRRTGNGEE